MAAAAHASKTYVIVWAWLIGLLLTGVAIAELPVSKEAVVIGVLILSTIKAVLVLLHYMHLKTDRRLLIFVWIAPFILIGLALSVVFSSRLVRI